jgi:hypothetical protein
MPNLQEKTSAIVREHPALQKMKFITFLWVIFSLLDLDPDGESGSGYGYGNPIESGSNPGLDTDPDPQHMA